MNTKVLQVTLNKSTITLQVFKRFSFLLLAALVLLLASAVPDTNALETQVPLQSKIVQPTPIFHIRQPFDGDTVSGAVELAVFVPLFWHEAKDKFRPVVEWSFDGHQWQVMKDMGNGRFIARWHTTTVANGIYKLQARYYLGSASGIDKGAVRVTAVTVQVFNKRPPLADELICACAGLREGPTAWV